MLVSLHDLVEICHIVHNKIHDYGCNVFPWSCHAKSGPHLEWSPGLFSAPYLVSHIPSKWLGLVFGLGLRLGLGVRVRVRVWVRVRHKRTI